MNKKIYFFLTLASPCIYMYHCQGTDYIITLQSYEGLACILAYYHHDPPLLCHLFLTDAYDSEARNRDVLLLSCD